MDAFLTIKIHKNEMSRRWATEWEKHPLNARRRDDDFYIQEYKKKKEILKTKIENNTSLGKFEQIIE